VDLTTNWKSPGLEVQLVRATQRCDICTKRSSDRMFALSERVVSPESPSACRQAWHLCEECAAAVVTEVERAALRTPLRTRIAVGVVAAARRPAHQHMMLGKDVLKEIRDEKLDRLALGFVLCMFALPPLVFLLVVVLLVLNGVGR
jgi:hypothetical protein